RAKRHDNLELLATGECREPLRKQPANITCEAYGAAKITFTCAGTQIPPSSVTTYESFDESRGVTLVRSTIQVSRSDVVNNEADEDFWCECSAWVDDSTIGATSSRAVISLAYMKKKFVEEPMSQTARVGSMVVFNCIPPSAEPFPEILWRKDGRRINNEFDDNFVEGADGSLTIVTVRQQDAGSYECVARNDAARRESSPATLTVTDEDPEAEVPTTTEAPQTTTPVKTAKPRRERDSQSKPVFYEEPEQNVYVTPTEPVQIVCDVEGADIMTFRCNGVRQDREKLDTKEDRASKTIRSVLNLTYAEVENYKNSYREDSYQCECVAWYTDGSNPAWQFAKSATGNLDQDFLEEPRDVRAQEGTSATIPCSPPEGKPDPWVYWVFEQQRLDPRSDSRYVVGADGSLTIRNVNKYDNGRYYCVAENQMGMRQSRVGTLEVSDEPVAAMTEPPTTTAAAAAYVPTFPAVIPDTPVFTHNLDPVYYLNENGEATLITSVVAADMLTYRCNGERLQEDQQVIDVLSDRASRKRLLTATTVVTNFDLEDSQVDEYSCQAYAWYILDGQWKFLTGTEARIVAPYLEADFSYEPEGGFYYVGDTAEFACQAPMGGPEPTISWVKDGYVIDPEVDNNYVLMEGGALLVESVRPEDAGEYVCVATNAAGSRRSRPAILEVADDGSVVEEDTTTTRRPTTPFVAETTPPRPPAENYIIRDQPVSLTCTVVAATVLVFNCNGERVKKEGQGYKTTDPMTGYTIIEKVLEISRDEVEAHDAQSTEPYTCQCLAYYQGEGGQDDWQNVPTEPAHFKKMFEKEPVSQSIQLGVPTELECRPPQGNPPPTVHWLKDGFKVMENNNYRVTDAGSLMIESVSEDDAGNYTCVAQNIVKTRYSQTVPVTVMTGEPVPTPKPETDDGDDDTDDMDETPEPTGEPAVPEGEGQPEPDGAQPPHFVAEPEATYYIIKSNPVTITCQARGADRITFNCNANNIPESRVQYQDMLMDNDMAGSDGSILAASIDVSREEVENYKATNTMDEFWCQCSARYIVPDMSDPQYLASSKGYVQVAYLKRSFKREPFNLTVDAGEFVSLPCEAPEGNPVPEVYWLFNGERVEQAFPSPDGAYIIDAATALNAGTYQCVAENVANKRMSRPALVYVTVGGVVVTGSPMDGGVAEPEPTGEPTPEPEYDMEDQKMCLDLIKQCSQLMPNVQRDQLNCQNLPQYVNCIDNFLDQCSGAMPDESIAGARASKEGAQNDCPDAGTGSGTGTGQVCQELMMCQAQYADQTVPNDDRDTMPMVALCSGIQSFLRCADRAAGQCNIPMDSPDTSLTDLAAWFEQYCERVVDDDWAGQCNAMSRCDLPIEQTTILGNLVKISLWCPYVHKTFECTSQAVANCGLDNVDEDLGFLQDMTMDTCPKSQTEPEPGAEGEGEGDTDDDGNIIEGGGTKEGAAMDEG
ncbi:hypothetical protein BaRGS_00020911, partial [Batillaria attramentaria]